VTQKPENPFAFPLAMLPESVDNPGMTLRDWFAGQALMGLLALPSDDGWKPEGGHQKHYSETAYRYADAMLAERQKGGEA
jgi:hypothetical protein